MESAINTLSPSTDSRFFTGEIEQLTRISTPEEELICYEAYSTGVPPTNALFRNFLSQEKEGLYLRIVKNLFRKNDFSELLQALEDGEITDEEYDRELEENEQKYLIPYPKEKADFRQIAQIVDIVKKLGKEKDFSVADISELFSLDLSDALDVIASPEAALILR